MNNFKVRDYHPSDLIQHYKICLETGNSGKDATGTVDPQLLGHYFLAPYCILEPASCFTLTLNDDPVGYIVGTADTKAFSRRCESTWFPALRLRYPDITKPSNYSERMICAIHRGIDVPSFCDAYPAHLHIDNLPAGQGKGQGKRMMDSFLAAMWDRGVPGVHLGVGSKNQRAVDFYGRYGFHEITMEGQVHYLGINP